MQDNSLSRAAIAVLSSSDLGGLGDQLLAHVTGRELQARLPDVQLVAFAPLGWDRQGGTETPLARPERTTTARIVESAQASVLCPAFPLGDDLSERYSSPQAQWAEPYFGGGFVEPAHGVLVSGVRVAKPTKKMVAAIERRHLFAVRDKVSKERLEAVGVKRDISVIPHPGIAIDPAAFSDRIAGLRKLGMVPDGEYVVSAGGVRLPGDAPLEDKLAILANAKFVVAYDEHTAAAAAGLEVPWVLVDPTGSETPPVLEFGDPKQIVKSDAEVDTGLKVPSRKREALRVLAEHFDQLISAYEVAVVANDGHPARRWSRLVEENRALRHANNRLRERMVLERERMIEPIATVVAENDELAKQLEIARASYANMVEQNKILQAQVADRDRELLAWQNLKLIRLTNPVRNAYSKVRGFLR